MLICRTVPAAEVNDIVEHEAECACGRIYDAGRYTECYKCRNSAMKQCECGDHYDSRRYTECYECAQARYELDYAECECGRGKYDTTKYDQCYNCAQEKWPDTCPECGTNRYDSSKYKRCYACMMAWKGNDTTSANRNRH